MSRLSTPTKRPTQQKTTARVVTKSHILLLLLIFAASLILGVVIRYKPHEHLYKHFIHTSQKWGFVVKHIHIQGNHQLRREDIMRSTHIMMNKPMILIDLPQAYQNLTKLPWVKTATLHRQFPNTITITIEERTPFALWQVQNKLHLVDDTGSVITPVNIEHFYGLPHILGSKAPQHAHELLSLLPRFKQLNRRITSRIFVDEHRWDLVLDKKVRVRLPQMNVEKALVHLATLEEKGHINIENVVSIDVRIPNRTYFELTPQALARQLKAVERAP